MRDPSISSRLWSPAKCLSLPLLSSLTFHPRHHLHHLHRFLFFFGFHSRSFIPHPDSLKPPGNTFIQFHTTDRPTHSLPLCLRLSLSQSHSLIAFCQLLLLLCPFLDVVYYSQSVGVHKNHPSLGLVISIPPIMHVVLCSLMPHSYGVSCFKPRSSLGV